MWNIIVAKYIKYHSRRSSRLRDKRFISFSEANHIIVLAEVQGAQQVLPHLQKLVSIGKKVTLYYFTYALKQNGLIFPGIDTVEISLQELCWGHNRPCAEVCEKFLALNADVLIDLTLSAGMPVESFVAISQVAMRFGVEKNAIVPADIMISLSSESITVEDLLQNILHYWNTLR